jgi:peptide deformylase
MEEIRELPETDLDVVLWQGWDDPVLSKVCEPFAENEFGTKLEDFVSRMIASMKRNRGVGLAGSQVGVLRRVFVMQPEWPKNAPILCECGCQRGDHEGMGLSRGRPVFSACGNCDCNQWRPKPDKEPSPLLVCNPKIELSGAEVSGKEGCLSLPGIYELVNRPTHAVMQYRTPLGDTKEIELNGLDARVAQHEDDHLNGIMFFDRRRVGRHESRAVERAWEKSRSK